MFELRKLIGAQQKIEFRTVKIKIVDPQIVNQYKKKKKAIQSKDNRYLVGNLVS